MVRKLRIAILANAGDTRVDPARRTVPDDRREVEDEASAFKGERSDPSDHSPGREGVTRLEYEAYEGVVEEKIAAVVAEAQEQWPVLGAAVAHRVGSLEVGEITVAVAVSSAHRADAFEAGRFVIDEVKRRAPIWKKEHWPGGAEWVREGEHGTF